MSGEIVVLRHSVVTSILTSEFSKPETYERPHVGQDVIIHDISGDEKKYTLDSHGFQIENHTSKEKDFLDDDKLKAEYYPETEQLLKDAYVYEHICIATSIG